MEFLEKRLDTKIFQVGLHRDEGKLIHKKSGLKLVSGKDFFANPKNKKLYFDEQFKKPINMDYFEVEKNYHAHFEMMGIDSEGKAIKRNRLSRSFLKELQTFTAKSLQMERGKEVVPYSKQEMNEIKAQLKDKSEYSNSREYGIAFNKVAKELGYFKKKTKRLDTHDHKAKAKIENDAEKKALIKNQKLTKEANATIFAVKAEANELKKELQTLTKKLIREDWAKYEAEVKTLKAEAKAKELTVPELNSRMAELRAKFIKPVLSNMKTLEKDNAKLKAEVKELKEEVATQDTTIKAKDAQIVSQDKEIEELKSENSKLADFRSKVMKLFGEYVEDFVGKKTPDTVLKAFERTILGFKAQIKILSNQLKLHDMKEQEQVSSVPVVDEEQEEQRAKAMIEYQVVKPFREMLNEGFSTEDIAEFINSTLKGQTIGSVLDQKERSTVHQLANYLKRAEFATIVDTEDVERLKNDDNLVDKIFDALYKSNKKEVVTEKEPRPQPPKPTRGQGQSY